MPAGDDRGFIDVAVDNSIARMMELAGNPQAIGLKPFLSGAGGMLVGMAAIAYGAGWIGNLEHPGWPLVVAAGAFVTGIGYVTAAIALELGEAALRAGWRATLLCILVAYNWLALTAAFGTLGAVGSLTGLDLVRIAAVALDIYVVLAVARAAAGRLVGRRWQHQRLAYAGLSLAAALALQLSGALSPLYAGFAFAQRQPDLEVDGVRAWELKADAPTQPLAAYAGGWRVPAGGADTGLARIEVAVAGERATVHLWSICPAKECDAGSFAALVESRRAGEVRALRIAGRRDGVAWIVTLMPNGGRPGILLLVQRGDSRFAKTASLRRVR